MTNIAMALHVDAIAKAYGATVALDGASFAVRPGEVHALLGENGAGKSTMVKMLSGLVQPDAGTIRAGRHAGATAAAGRRAAARHPDGVSGDDPRQGPDRRTEHAAAACADE